MQSTNFSRIIFTTLALLVALILISDIDLVSAGGKGKGKGEQDIILYNGKIVMKGDKKGGTIILANDNSHEDIEFMPSPFHFGHGDSGHGHGHGHMWGRRR